MEITFSISVHNKPSAEQAVLKLRALAKMCEDLVPSLPEGSSLSGLVNPTQTEMDLGNGPAHPSEDPELAKFHEKANMEKVPERTREELEERVKDLREKLSEKPQEAPKEETPPKATKRKRKAKESAPAKPQAPSLADVRTALGRLADSGGISAVDGCLAAFGATRISEVAEDQRAALIERATEALNG